MHSPVRWLLTGVALACAGFAVTAAEARAAYSVVDQNCLGGDPALGCATSFIGDGGNNVMTVEPAAAGMVRFTESSPNPELDTGDGAEPWPSCQLQMGATSALCPLASNGGQSYMHGADGNDTLILKPGATGLARVAGYAGDDTIYANDGNVQTEINC